MARRLMKGAAVAKGKLGLATDKAAAPIKGIEMGKKLNPEYRARLTERKSVPKCAACTHRSKYLPQYTNPVTGSLDYFHKGCYRLFCDRHRVLLLDKAAKKEAIRQEHISIKSFWSNPDLEIAKAVAGFTDDVEVL